MGRLAIAGIVEDIPCGEIHKPRFGRGSNRLVQWHILGTNANADVVALAVHSPLSKKCTWVGLAKGGLIKLGCNASSWWVHVLCATKKLAHKKRLFHVLPQKGSKEAVCQRGPNTHMKECVRSVVATHQIWILFLHTVWHMWGLCFALVSAHFVGTQK